VVTLALIGLVGGVLAGISPCILPVLPVIFVSGGVQGARTARPYLVVAGLTVSFSLFTLFGSLVLRALHLPADLIRWAGLVALVLLGIAMIVPQVDEILQRPFARLQRQTPSDRGGFVLGLALGAVYVPCAGPVLAAITVAGATGQIGLRTVVLTAAFAIGTAIPLLAFALAGRRMAERLKAFRRHQRRVRITAGAVVIVLALALTFNLTDAIQRLIPDYTAKPASALNNGALHNPGGGVDHVALGACAQYYGTAKLEDCGPAPEFAGIDGWFNTPNNAAMTMASLRGSVVLVDFWAYSCINCQRAIPHVEAWYQAYHDSGFQVVGVHTPEYAFEKVPGNVSAGARRLNITYPVALDNEFGTWNNFDNNSWPADYLIDANGNIRYVYIGEGDYPGTESLIRQLLTAAHPGSKLPDKTQVADTTPTSRTQTPELYLGAERANAFVGGDLNPGNATYAYPPSIADNSFALTGTWNISGESLMAVEQAGIALNFHAHDVYLDVGGTGTLIVTIDGTTTTFPVAGAPNIYAVVHRGSEEHGTVRIAVSPGLSVYSFTFG
jgi:cytochrome c biogenesis protein CcdA/thiol-disulfide isomerase/thioredoxin